MKVIAINRREGEELRRPLNVDVMPDSALIMPGRPTFLPDFATMWRGVWCVAFRVSRLGKNVSARFANRYYDAMTLAFRLVPTDVCGRIGSEGRGCGLAGAFDNCLTLGEWMPIGEGEIEIGLKAGGEEAEWKVSVDSLGIDRAVELVSEWATLKIGDVIMPAEWELECSPEAGMTIEGSVDGTRCLNVRIK